MDSGIISKSENAKANKIIHKKHNKKIKNETKQLYEFLKPQGKNQRKEPKNYPSQSEKSIEIFDKFNEESEKSSKSACIKMIIERNSSKAKSKRSLKSSIISTYFIGKKGKVFKKFAFLDIDDSTLEEMIK